MHASIIAFFDSPFDLGALLVVVLLLFGSTKLPKLARSLGSAQKEFKKGLEEGEKGAESDAGTQSQGDTQVKGGGSQPQGGAS